MIEVNLIQLMVKSPGHGDSILKARSILAKAVQ